MRLLTGIFCAFLLMTLTFGCGGGGGNGGDASRVPIPVPSPTPTKPAPDITPTADESQLASLIQNVAGQHRLKMNFNPTLASVARAHAKDMSDRGYFSHTDPDGNGPNQRVTNAGYALPSWYDKGQTANQVESIAEGQETAEATLAEWLTSPSHRAHVLAENSFFAGQIDFGIGHYYDPIQKKHYWVFIAAQPAS